MSIERVKEKVFEYLEHFPTSTVNDLAKIFCRRGCKRSDLVEILVDWRAETREQTTFLDEPKKEDPLVIKENQIVPKSYKKPSQKRITQYESVK